MIGIEKILNSNPRIIAHNGGKINIFLNAWRISPSKRIIRITLKDMNSIDVDMSKIEIINLSMYIKHLGVQQLE